MDMPRRLCLCLDHFKTDVKHNEKPSMLITLRALYRGSRAKLDQSTLLLNVAQ